MPVQYAKQPATAADQTLNPDGHVPTVLDGIPRQLLIGGEWLPAAGGDTMAVLNPAIAQQFTSVADAGVTDAEAAVAAAAAAQ